MRINLALCPSELIALDPNGGTLWPKLLRKVVVTVSKGEHIEERQAWILRNFGLPSLLQRLRPGMNERERARIWRREAAACSEGESISDITPENLHVLNPWIVSADQRYAYARTSAGEIERRRGRPEKCQQEKRANNAARQRRHRAAKRHVLF